MPDYSNSVIYSIRFYDNDKIIYIGSTIQQLSVKFAADKKNLSSSLCKYIIDKYNGNYNCCYIELLEFFECKTKQELNKKEGEIIRKYQADNN